MIQYKITSAITNGTERTISAKCCEQISIRKDEHGMEIPIIRCRNVSIVILIEDQPKMEELKYIKTQIENAYNTLPDETLINSLNGKKWSK